MAGKKKKGGGKKGKKSGKKSGKESAGNDEPLVLPGGGNPDEMSNEAMVQAMKQMQADMRKEAEERNYFQVERDKIATFWDITKKQLVQVKDELHHKDREIEEADERHQVEIKVYKQKVKHLLYEHQNNITALKSQGVTQLKLQQAESAKQEHNVIKEKRELAVNLKDAELAHDDVVHNLKISHDQEITTLRREFERKVQEIQQKFDKKARHLHEELALRRKNEVHEIEERKNMQINSLMKNHEKAFGDIKNYYNDITLNNLALINSLKEQVEEMKKKEDRNEKLMVDITNENKRLTEPLNKALADVDECRRQLANYEKDKASLQNCKSRLKVNQKQLKSLTWEQEVLEQRFTQVQKERDDLYEKFVQTIYDVQQKSGFRNLLLQKKLSALADQLERKEAQLNEVLAASDLEPAALATVSQKLEDVLDSKNHAIKDLQYELARVCKAHNDVIKTYDAKLTDFGIPSVDLGFKPLTTIKTTGKGPAGLVSK